MDFNRLTVKSQEAVAGAQERARRAGNPELYPEHLLLALLDQELPQQLVGDAAALRADAEARLTTKPSVHGGAQQPQVGAAFSRVLDRALDEMRQLEDELARLRRRMERMERELREEIRTVHRSYRREVVLYRESEPPAPRNGRR